MPSRLSVLHGVAGARAARSPPLARGRVPPACPLVHWLGRRCPRPRPQPRHAPSGHTAAAGPQAAGLPAEGLPRAPALSLQPPRVSGAGLRGDPRLDSCGVASEGLRTSPAMGAWALLTSRNGHLDFFLNYVWFVFFFPMHNCPERIKGFLLQGLSYPHLLQSTVVSSVFTQRWSVGRQTQGYIWSSLAYCTLFLYSSSWRNS